MSLVQRSGYEIRRFRREDADQCLALFARNRDGSPTDDWFRWKYEDNPYADHVPVYVATYGGDVVGAVGMWPLRMRLGRASAIGLQPSDAVVDPDHADEDLYDDLVAEALDDYRSGEPAFCFTFPNGDGGGEAFEWETVSELPTYYRVHDPSGLMDLPGPLDRAGRVLAGGYLSACDRIAPSVSSLAVDRYDGVPADVFADLYRDQVPAAIHAARDEKFYRWRFDNPRWTYESFVARNDGGPVAGAVVARRPGDDSTVRIVDVAPLLPPDGGDHYTSLLDGVVEAHSDADVIAAHPDVVPHGVLSRFGFHRDDALPLSRLSRRTRFGVYPLAGATTINGYDLTDRSAWLMTFSEQDTA